MARTTLWGHVLGLCLLALPLTVEAGSELELGAGVVKVGSVANVPLTLTTTDEVQGLVAAFEWDAALGEGVDLVVGAALADADVVVTRVEASYMVLGAVVDNDGVAPSFIGPGDDLALATARIQAMDVEGTLSIAFADAKYATVEGGPLLENIVVVGGLSIGIGEGLGLTGGSLEVVPGFNRFYIDPASATNTSGSTGTARVLLENVSPVEGYVVALCHDGAELELTAVAKGAAATAQDADFEAADVSAAGGTLGVVIDLNPPFTNNVIPVGDGNHVASFTYRCLQLPATGTKTTPLTFCDNVLGTPLKENVIVVGGLSVSPALENGVFTCKATAPVSEICNNGVDDDGDGLKDCDDPSCFGSPICEAPGPEQRLPFAARSPDGTSTEVGINPGEVGPFGLFVKSLDFSAEGQGAADVVLRGLQPTQGFSMAMAFECELEVPVEDMDISGTILEAVGAEFISVQADNDDGDDDGCELIVGVLLDALPPFNGQVIPASESPQKVGEIGIRVRDGECGDSFTLVFQDGVNGRGRLPIRNLMSVANESYSVAGEPLTVRVVGAAGGARFVRGDCNSSRLDPGITASLAVDIADAASVVSFLFLPKRFKPNVTCLDACDCNDDERIDLADAVCVLQFLFGADLPDAKRFPPAPYAGWKVDEATGALVRTEAGPDPKNIDPLTGEDLDAVLDCKDGNACD